MDYKIQNVRMTPFLHPETIITTEHPVQDLIIIQLNVLAKQHNVFRITTSFSLENNGLFLDAEFVSEQDLSAFRAAVEVLLNSL